MTAVLRVRTVLCLVIVGLMMVTLAPAGSSSARRASTLSVSPKVYVGGQSLTFQGNLGRSGQQRIHLQTHMGRAGDAWTDLPGFSTLTKADGSFRFTHRAPSMFGIKLRVVGGGAATPAFNSVAQSQDLVLKAVSNDSGLGPGQELAGVPFTINVDTTPTLPARPDLPGPAFPGRVLTLQQRVNGSQWSTLDTTTVNQSGNASFSVTVDQAGPVVYRVRQENWTANGNQIGWFPSFPTPVDVVARRPSAPRTTHTTSTTPAPARVLATPAARTNGPAATAGGTYRWGASRWDFAWEFGESLSSPPYRGTVKKGWWRDASNGSGRVGKHNGGLMLDSQRERYGAGDFGTTSATLHGNPMTYGRWETKLRLKSPERNARDYRVRLELVPERAADYHCGAQNIVMANFSAHGSKVTVGAKSLQGAKWSYTRPLASLIDNSAAFAVEVTKGHITWFLNGRPIATVKNSAAVSDVPMTLRLSLVGQGQSEMNRTQAIFDWQRGFSADPGRVVTSGHGLTRTTFAGGC